mmetsp:Transcript_28832/g.56041  ORF Transcript_28832/g.56041 Transcript_28832/m.56041 type:complete len:85 (-) Transcript_28832:688-942(-)
MDNDEEGAFVEVVAVVAVVVVVEVVDVFVVVVIFGIGALIVRGCEKSTTFWRHDRSETDSAGCGPKWCSSVRQNLQGSVSTPTL